MDSTAIRLAELTCYIPEFREKRAALLRQLAARIGREAGLTEKEGFENLVAINRALTSAIRLGYALAEYDRHQGPVTVRCQTLGLVS